MGVLFSCNKEKDILSEDKMSEILSDMCLVEGFTQEKNIRDINRFNFERDSLYYLVFSIHEIEQKIFEKSYEFYCSQPVRLKRIWDNVKEDLNKIEVSQ